MNDLFASFPVDGIRFEIAVQHIFLWMQNYAKMTAEYFELHLFNDIERMVALFWTSFYDFVMDFVRMNRFIVM